MRRQCISACINVLLTSSVSNLLQQLKPKYSRLDSSRASSSHVKFRKGMLYRNEIKFYSCTEKVHRAYIHSYSCYIKESLNYHAQWNINGKYKELIQYMMN